MSASTTRLIIGEFMILYMFFFFREQFCFWVGWSGLTLQGHRPSLTGLVGLPAVHDPAVPAIRSADGPEVGEGHGSVVVCRGGGRQAAGVGGVRGLAGRGGVICQ